MPEHRRRFERTRIGRNAHPPEAAAERGLETGSIVAEISREVVGIYAQYYGRGPTKAKAVWRNAIVTVILEEIFTKAEAVLVEAGKFQAVRANRQAFQDEVEPLFRAAIERATGKSVRSFMSQVSPEGIAAEVFVLAEQDRAAPAPPRRNGLRTAAGAPGSKASFRGAGDDDLHRAS